jgi:hypothetical protein
MYYFTNGTYDFGSYADVEDEDGLDPLLPVIPCTESIYFLADQTATGKSGKCAKIKFGDVYNTITSTISYVLTGDGDDLKECVQDAKEEGSTGAYNCVAEYYTRMGGLAAASGPNYKNNKPNFVDVDFDYSAADEVSRVEYTHQYICMYP